VTPWFLNTPDSALLQRYKRGTCYVCRALSLAVLVLRYRAAGRRSKHLPLDLDENRWPGHESQLAVDANASISETTTLCAYGAKNILAAGIEQTGDA